MKAAVYKTAGQPLTIEDIAEPEPGPSDLILKVKACGICGTDLHWSESTDASGGWGWNGPWRLQHGAQLSANPDQDATMQIGFQHMPNHR